MGRVYAGAAERLIEDEKDPVAKREYTMILLQPQGAEFDAAHTSVDDVMAAERGDGTPANKEVTRVALRTQTIKDPGSALSAGGRILQFFAQNANAPDLMGNTKYIGVIFETRDEDTLPLFWLSPGDVFELVRGAGFSAPLYVSEGVTA